MSLYITWMVHKDMCWLMKYIMGLMLRYSHLTALVMVDVKNIYFSHERDCQLVMNVTANFCTTRRTFYERQFCSENNLYHRVKTLPPRINSNTTTTAWITILQSKGTRFRSMDLQVGVRTEQIRLTRRLAMICICFLQNMEEIQLAADFVTPSGASSRYQRSVRRVTFTADSAMIVGGIWR